MLLDAANTNGGNAEPIQGAGPQMPSDANPMV
jgi:hypothetical protein